MDLGIENIVEITRGSTFQAYKPHPLSSPPHPPRGSPPVFCGRDWGDARVCWSARRLAGRLCVQKGCPRMTLREEKKNKNGQLRVSGETIPYSGHPKPKLVPLLWRSGSIVQPRFPPTEVSRSDGGSNYDPPRTGAAVEIRPRATGGGGGGARRRPENARSVTMGRPRTPNEETRHVLWPTLTLVFHFEDGGLQRAGQQVLGQVGRLLDRQVVQHLRTATTSSRHTPRVVPLRRIIRAERGPGSNSELFWIQSRFYTSLS